MNTFFLKTRKRHRTKHEGGGGGGVSSARAFEPQDKERMASAWQLDPRGIIFPITKPPPKSWADISLVHGRVSRHWGLIRGLIVSPNSRGHSFRGLRSQLCVRPNVSAGNSSISDIQLFAGKIWYCIYGRPGMRLHHLEKLRGSTKCTTSVQSSTSNFQRLDARR